MNSGMMGNPEASHARGALHEPAVSAAILHHASLVTHVGKISEAVGRLTILREQTISLRLRRINRVGTIRGSLAIEGNTLTEAQVTAILDGKRVIASPREVQEVRMLLLPMSALTIGILALQRICWKRIAS